MSIQHCPDEVLDMIFQLLPFQSPDKAPAVLLPTILTCSRFCVIAKRHLIRVVCLKTAERINLFAAFLAQLTDAGAYGKALLPIEHMAAFGKYQIPQGRPWRRASQAEKEAECILPSIISIAAPSLRSLTVFGFNFQSIPRKVDGRRVRNTVKSSVCFPKLQRLILLEQHIVELNCNEEQNKGSPYPQLASLYVHGGQVTDDVLALSTLRELRLDMLKATDNPNLPSPSILETIIIDAPPYESHIRSGCFRWQQTESMYQERIEHYHAFVKAYSSSPASCVVVAEGVNLHPETVLDAWKDIVQGGSGCWKQE